MLALVGIILIVLWALGLLAHVGGIINLLLIIGVIVVIAHFLRGRNHSRV